jgi:hypothetical protein
MVVVWWLLASREQRKSQLQHAPPLAKHLLVM